jgi:hypothetical protein
MPKTPRKKTDRRTLAHLVTGVPKPWTEGRKKLMQAKMNRLAKKIAAELGAEAVVMTAFWPTAEDRDTIHMQTGGQSPYPLGLLFGLLKEKFAPEETAAQGQGDTIN